MVFCTEAICYLFKQRLFVVLFFVRLFTQCFSVCSSGVVRSERHVYGACYVRVGYSYQHTCITKTKPNQRENQIETLIL